MIFNKLSVFISAILVAVSISLSIVAWSIYIEQKKNEKCSSEQCSVECCE
jgi:hypothetical protein